jgi:hypothetical protein
MKTQKLNKFFILVLFLMGWTGTYAQERLESEVPGDNFSLEGALELFKKSESPEEFEKMLNSSNSRVNNLDLNGDGNIDYIRVIDRNEGNVHLFILQAVLSRTESQDVAVIELEKLGNGKAVLQITGDADVYGVETIIEPTEEIRVYAGTTTTHTVVNVWAWPFVRFVYSPYYTVWVSPWRWSYYPFWWEPWRPVAYYVYDPWWRPYRSYYAVCYYHRIGYIPTYYRPYRRSSVIVYNNYRHQIDRYRSNNGNRNRNDGRVVNNDDGYNGRNGRDRNGNGYRSDNNYSDNRSQANIKNSRSNESYSNDDYRSTIKNRSGSKLGGYGNQEASNESNSSSNLDKVYRSKSNNGRSGDNEVNNSNRQQPLNEFKSSPNRNETNREKFDNGRSGYNPGDNDKKPLNDFKSSTNRNHVNRDNSSNGQSGYNPGGNRSQQPSREFKSSPNRQTLNHGQRNDSKPSFNRGNYQSPSRSQSVGRSSNGASKPSGGGNGGGRQRGRN